MTQKKLWSSWLLHWNAQLESCTSTPTAWKSQKVMLLASLSTLFQRPSEGVGKCDFRVTAGRQRHARLGRWWLFLSVLKSHFARPCIRLFKQLLSKSEKRFVRTHWLQEVLGLSEVLWERTVLFVGKCEFRFRRFEQGSRAPATRAKACRLDQNRQSPDCTTQRSNHWAKTTNLTCQDVNHCDYKAWLQKRIHNQKNMLNRSLIARQLWCWVPQWR